MTGEDETFPKILCSICNLSNHARQIPFVPGAYFSGLCARMCFLLIVYKGISIDKLIREISVASDFPFKLAKLYLLQIPHV